MQATEGKIGRVFVVRLEDGDRLPDALESLAEERGIEAAAVLLLGGIKGGRVVVGPKETTIPPEPVLRELAGAHEIAAVGTLFRHEGKPCLHLHGALGRGENVVAGCTRPGVEVYLVGEAIVLEILGTGAERVHDPESGLALLRLLSSRT